MLQEMGIKSCEIGTGGLKRKSTHTTITGTQETLNSTYLVNKMFSLTVTNRLSYVEKISPSISKLH
jgi:hypothetical protein